MVEREQDILGSTGYEIEQENSSVRRESKQALEVQRQHVTHLPLTIRRQSHVLLRVRGHPIRRRRRS